MTSAAITVLGLGPGSMRDLTLAAHEALLQAASSQRTVYFRTLIHPTVEPLKEALPDLRIESFDRLYDESTNWSTLYEQIALEVCTLAAQQPIMYAVPGHPLVGEFSVQLILRMAKERGLTYTIVGGLSFLEPVCSVLGLDPFDAGMQIVDAANLAALGTDEIAGRIVPGEPLLVAQVYNRRLASAVKLALGECYPDEWPVKLIRAAGVPSEETIIELPLYELDRESYANHLSTLYVPPTDPLSPLRLPETLRYVTMRLRREPDGCPWDRKQTHRTLTRYMIEESYEAVAAIDADDMENLAEELGDLLLQVYLHAEIARQEGEFTIGDVFEHVNAKLIRRHPHVFGNVEVESASQVVQNWEEIKRQERLKAGKKPQDESIFDNVKRALPALMVAQEYEKRASSVGFIYPTLDGIYGKLQEEIQETREASTQEELIEEIGDVLFMVVEIAQYHKIDAEQSLRLASDKFRRRFQKMEEIARGETRTLSSFTLSEWEALWQRAKAEAH